MSILFYSVILLTAVLSLLDLYNTAKLVDEFGLDIEANPIAKWAWKKWGTKALVAFKLVLTTFYVVAMGLIPITPIIFGVAITVGLVYSWVASRGYTIKTILIDK